MTQSELLTNAGHWRIFNDFMQQILTLFHCHLFLVSFYENIECSLLMNNRGVKTIYSRNHEVLYTIGVSMLVTLLH